MVDWNDANDRLRRIAEAFEAGDELSASQRRVAVAALRRQALVLPAAVFIQRDALIVRCRFEFFAQRSDHDAAQEIASDWRRYAAAGWIRERSHEACPARHAGSLKALLWAIMKISPRVLSAERIRKIVGHLK